MFGYAAFAQPSFAALSGSIYAVTISEGATLADLNLGQATFNTVLIEAFTSTDSSSVITNFVGLAIEPITSADSNTVVRTQFAVINEPVNLLDAPIGFAWVKIDNTESTQWVLVDNRQ